MRFGDHRPGCILIGGTGILVAASIVLEVAGRWFEGQWFKPVQRAAGGTIIVLLLVLIAGSLVWAFVGSRRAARQRRGEERDRPPDSGGSEDN